MSIDTVLAHADAELEAMAVVGFFFFGAARRQRGGGQKREDGPSHSTIPCSRR